LRISAFAGILLALPLWCLPEKTNICFRIYAKFPCETYEKLWTFSRQKYAKQRDNFVKIFDDMRFSQIFAKIFVKIIFFAKRGRTGAIFGKILAEIKIFE
jgi:hypothetical protein